MLQTLKLRRVPHLYRGYFYNKMVADKPTLDIFTGSEDLGLIYQEQDQINNKFTEGNIPFSTTTGNYQINWKGKTRLIVLQGAHDGDGFAGVDDNTKLKQFILTVEDWINTSIMTTREYRNSFGVAYNVYMIDWTWTRSFSDSNRIIYTMIFKEA